MQTSDIRSASHRLRGTDGSDGQPAELPKFHEEDGRRGIALNDHLHLGAKFPRRENRKIDISGR